MTLRGCGQAPEEGDHHALSRFETARGAHGRAGRPGLGL